MQPQSHHPREGKHDKGRAQRPPRARMPRPEPEAARMPRPERAAAGKRLRESIPREAHDRFAIRRGRDPLALIEATNKERLADLVKLT